MSLEKKTLEKALKFISDIELDESEQKIIFNKVKDKISALRDTDLLRKIEDLSLLPADLSFNKLFSLILEKIDINQLNKILKIFLNDEDLINYLQDLLLEKLI